MVEPVDAVVERSEPGEVEAEGKVAVKFSISDVRAAKVSRGFIVATSINIIARFLKSPERIIGCIGEIFEKGKTQPVSARWREVEKERRSTIVKCLNRTFRVVVAKTTTCYIVVTVHPYPNRPHDVDCDQRTRQSSSSA